MASADGCQGDCRRRQGRDVNRELTEERDKAGRLELRDPGAPFGNEQNVGNLVLPERWYQGVVLAQPIQNRVSLSARLVFKTPGHGGGGIDNERHLPAAVLDHRANADTAGGDSVAELPKVTDDFLGAGSSLARG